MIGGRAVRAIRAQAAEATTSAQAARTIATWFASAMTNPAHRKASPPTSSHCSAPSSRVENTSCGAPSRQQVRPRVKAHSEAPPTCTGKSPRLHSLPPSQVQTVARSTGCARPAVQGVYDLQAAPVVQRQGPIVRGEASELHLGRTGVARAVD